MPSSSMAAGIGERKAADDSRQRRLPCFPTRRRLQACRFFERPDATSRSAATVLGDPSEQADAPAKNVFRADTPGASYAVSDTSGRAAPATSEARRVLVRLDRPAVREIAQPCAPHAMARRLRCHAQRDRLAGAQLGYRMFAPVCEAAARRALRRRAALARAWAASVRCPCASPRSADSRTSRSYRGGAGLRRSSVWVPPPRFSPAYITATRSQTCATVRRLWLMNRIAIPCLRRSSLTRFRTLCLDRHVKRRRRLVHDQERRPGDERHRDDDALLLSAPTVGGGSGP